MQTRWTVSCQVHGLFHGFSKRKFRKAWNFHKECNTSDGKQADVWAINPVGRGWD